MNLTDPISAVKVAVIQQAPVFLNIEHSLLKARDLILVLDTSGHYSRPDVFHLEVNDQPQLRVAFGSRQKLPAAR